jgi:hypothetical protein
LENALRLPPYDSLPMLIENLKDMEWELPLPRLEQGGEKGAVPEDGREAET